MKCECYCHYPDVKITEPCKCCNVIGVVDIQMIYTMRQTIETWQKGCEVLVNDLITRVNELENKSGYSSGKKPFVCPRCNDLTDCDMCNSTGLVWG